MNKAELVGLVAEKAEITKAAAERILLVLQQTITHALKHNDPVTWPGFGTWIAKDRAARKGRNPQTGNPINIPASKVVGFKAAKALKDAVKEKADS